MTFSFVKRWRPDYMFGQIVLLKSIVWENQILMIHLCWLVAVINTPKICKCSSNVENCGRRRWQRWWKCGRALLNYSNLYYHSSRIWILSIFLGNGGNCEDRRMTKTSLISRNLVWRFRKWDRIRQERVKRWQRSWRRLSNVASAHDDAYDAGWKESCDQKARRSHCLYLYLQFLLFYLFFLIFPISRQYPSVCH